VFSFLLFLTVAHAFTNQHWCMSNTKYLFLITNTQHAMEKLAQMPAEEYCDPTAPFLPDVSEELLSKLFNSHPFCSSVDTDVEPTEGCYFYDRLVENGAQVPMIRAQGREIDNLRIEVEASDVDRVLSIVKGSFSDTEPDKVKDIAVSAGVTHVNLDKELHYFQLFRDTYTELSLQLSGPGPCTLKSSFVRVSETPWPQEEKDAIADALEKAVRLNVVKHFCGVREEYLAKVLDNLRAKPLICRYDVDPVDWNFYRFPELSDTAAFAAWLKQVVDSAVAVPSCWRNAICQYPHQPAFVENHSLAIEPHHSRALFSACVQATFGVTVHDTYGKPITTQGKPVVLTIGQNEVAVDIVDGEIKFDAPIMNPLAQYIYSFGVYFKWGAGGLPMDGEGVRVVQHALHFSSVIDGWLRDVRSNTAILPLIGDWSLIYDCSNVGPCKTTQARKYVIDMMRARAEEDAKDMAEARKRFGHMIAL
jgi:hypothetical protein